MPSGTNSLTVGARVVAAVLSQKQQHMHKDVFSAFSARCLDFAEQSAQLRQQEIKRMQREESSLEAVGDYDEAHEVSHDLGVFRAIHRRVAEAEKEQKATSDTAAESKPTSQVAQYVVREAIDYSSLGDGQDRGGISG